ncbi:MAG: putative peptidase M42 family [Puniceicoccaceae bacterium 5H]|nr:MAG: putative peptidase M42 family [Puniceicoccaceae bacterium 5H]
MAVSLPLDYLQDMLLELLSIHSPTGYTDPVVRRVSEELGKMGVRYELTRRGAIRATLPGEVYSPDRAVVVHLDTLGAQVKELKENGRLGLTPVGTWSARWAEGARGSIFTDSKLFRGSILPLKASGHVYDDEVDKQPVNWDNLEMRVDAPLYNKRDLLEAGFNVGDFVGIDSQAELLPNGYINARHLDDKAGVATMLAVIKFLKESKMKLPVDCHVLFTISEEVGIGASAGLHGDVAEMVTIDNGTMAPGQNTIERGVTVVMADSSGPFDYHLTHFLLHLCRDHGITHARDIFRYYRCDSASAIESGNDIRTSLITFGLDASHGYERTHLDSLNSVGQLLVSYMTSHPIFKRTKSAHISLQDFPETRKVPVATRAADEPDNVAQLPLDEAKTDRGERPRDDSKKVMPNASKEDTP